MINFSKLCGRVAGGEKLVGFSYYGCEAVPGQWPWLVSILLKQGRSLNFHCGGTLVSNKVVVTAAHCMFFENRPIDVINLRVSMGSQSHHLSTFIIKQYMSTLEALVQRNITMQTWLL